MTTGKAAVFCATVTATIAFGVSTLHAEPVSHHGMSVNPRATMVECLACHDGLLAHSVAHCTTECSILTSHSVQRSYPPRGKEAHYRPAADLKEYGVELTNGTVDCISCHDLENPEKNHPVQKLRGVGLCDACHIGM